MWDVSREMNPKNDGFNQDIIFQLVVELMPMIWERLEELNPWYKHEMLFMKEKNP